MAAKPIFAATPRQGQASVSVADTSYSGPASAQTVFLAPAGGSRVERVRVVAAGNTAAGVVNLWAHDGTNYRLLRSLVITAVTTNTTTTPPWGSDGAGVVYFEGGLILPSGWSLRVSTTIAQAFHVTADGADF